MGTYKYKEETFEKARELRREGNSYQQISNRVNVPLGTVTDWVNDIDLTQEKKEKIRSDSVKRRYCKSILECGTKNTIRSFLNRERERSCERCGRRRWNGKPITLEIHRTVDKSYSDVSENEIEWLCPNCHSQTDNWRGRK